MSLRKKELLKLSIFALLLGLIIAWLGFGERGFIHLYKMEKERQAHMQRIRKLESENQALLEEINLLRTDKTYLESVARKELGLVKEDEILYRFSSKRQTDDRPQKGKK